MKPELPLRDIHLPAEPSWWPPAPGWWLLALLLIVVISVASVLIRRRLLRQRHRRALLAEVDRIWDQHREQQGGVEVVAEWSSLLRRACLRYRPELASRAGVDWSQALGIDTDEGDPLGRLLVEAPFRPSLSKTQVAALREPVREALRRLIDGEVADGGRND